MHINPSGAGENAGSRNKKSPATYQSKQDPHKTNSIIAQAAGNENRRIRK